MKKEDNAQIASLVRRVVDEFGASQTNSVYDDPDTDRVFETFQGKNAEYWVIEHAGAVVGGCGFFPTAGLPAKCA